MFNTYNKIFVACPANVKTGGTELLHQLVHELNILDIEAYIVYYNYSREVPMPKDFEIYGTKYVTNIDKKDNNNNNILIVPEVNTSYMYKYKKMKHVIWWLSVDNYIKSIQIKKGELTFKIKSLIKNMLNRGDFKFQNNEEDIVHLCQSKYAIDFVRENRCRNIEYLSDYINETYISKKINCTKENIVLYNPKKGIEFTNKLIEYSKKDIKWMPIANMTNDEVKEILSKSKVYVDFGNHPGKDRFPREAAVSGCCILTGKRGSANYRDDVCIPDEYKFTDSDEEIYKIANMIKECLQNYERNIKNFAEYVNIIKNEKLQFKNDVKRIFLKNKI